MFNINPDAPPPVVAEDLEFRKITASVRPWIRFWARSFDGIVNGIIAAVPSAVLLNILGVRTEWVYAIVIIIGCIPIEAAEFALFGTTPGKWLLNTKVTHDSGQPITFVQSLKRTGFVFLLGYGLAIPIVNLFTMGTSLLTLKRDGITAWDSWGGFTVSHKPIGVLQGLIVATSFIAVGLIAR